MGMKHIKEHPKRDELIELGTFSTFFGIPTEDMDREDLLMVIGMLLEDRRQDTEMHRHDIDVLSNLHKAR